MEDSFNFDHIIRRSVYKWKLSEENKFFKLSLMWERVVQFISKLCHMKYLSITIVGEAQ